MKNTNTPSILHVSSARTWRGGEQQIAYLVEALQQKGVAQSILCVQDSEMEDWCIANSIPYKCYRKSSSIDLKTARYIKQICLMERHTIVHAHDSHAHTYACIAASLFRNTVPIVLHRRVDFPVKKNPLSYWKYNHPNIQRIICVSNAIKTILLPTIKDVNKLEVVHSAVDRTRFNKTVIKNQLRTEYGLPKKQILVANVAAIAAHKDYFTFVNTVAYLVASGIKATYFIIGGDGGEKAAVETYIAAKGLEKEIILTGFRADIPAILPEIDLFLFTSKEEGLGTSVLDAFACHVPVVATSAGGIPEMVQHEKTGLLTRVGDAQALAEQVLRLLKSPNLAQSLTQNAHDSLYNFSKEKMAKQVFTIYQTIK